ncbi:hypothetical protein CN918_29230 [Priestia megaterium]|nr:hypothetical protein CN918_29230 [Priestia megaterium]
MAWYRKFENNDDVLVEQNIFDNGELESYEAKITCSGQEKTAVLYFHEDDDKRFYSLGLLESVQDRNVTIVSNDLSEIFKYKTANTRRKYISDLIRKNEQKIKQMQC